MIMVRMVRGAEYKDKEIVTPAIEQNKQATRRAKEANKQTTGGTQCAVDRNCWTRELRYLLCAYTLCGVVPWTAEWPLIKPDKAWVNLKVPGTVSMSDTKQ